MMFKKNETITLIGGSGAIANNLSQFCKNVKIISYLGKSNNYENFISKNLDKNIKNEFLYMDVPTIQKEKYIDRDSGNKIVDFIILMTVLLIQNHKKTKKIFK